VSYVPLGGNGYTAPFAAYNVQGWTQTGDASAGNVEFILQPDPRFCSLFTFMTVNIEQVAPASAAFRNTLGGLRQASQGEAGSEVAVALLISDVTVEHTWVPVPVIMPGGNTPAGQTPIAFRSQWKNVDVDEFQFNAMVYIFNINVRETTPMGPLLWARGAT
jgi:hypothetical protein